MKPPTQARGKLRARPKESCRKSAADEPSSLSATHNDRHSRRSRHASEGSAIRALHDRAQNVPHGHASVGGASSYESFAGAPLCSRKPSIPDVRDERSSRSLRAQSRSASLPVSEWRLPCDSQNLIWRCVRTFELLRSYRPGQHFVTTKIKLRPSRDVLFGSASLPSTSTTMGGSLFRNSAGSAICNLRFRL